MLLEQMPDRPIRTPINSERQKLLYEQVSKALSTIQIAFNSTINIEGIDATDLFSMNTLLGSAIEVQTVQTLRNMRSIWDPNNEWSEYDFVRFPQSFPDVRLMKCDGSEAMPAIGIELKSWYLLSKEAEPSFRYKTTAKACSPCDLFVIVPWSLDNVLSGTPVVHPPFIEQAKYVSEMRNYYWINTRVSGNPQDKDAIEIPEGVSPYPLANSIITDKPVRDSGGNFGRVGRVHDLVGGWTESCLSIQLAGIPARDWIRFLRSHTESATISSEVINPTCISLKDLRQTAYAIIDFCESDYLRD